MQEEYVTIAEAARRLGKSEKTLRRMVHAGKLSARYPVPNRAEVAMSAIEALQGSQPVQAAPVTLEARIAVLERQVSILQDEVLNITSLAHLKLMNSIDSLHSQPRQEARSVRARQETLPLSVVPMRATPGLPEDAIRVYLFAEAHNMSNDTVKSQVRTKLLEAIPVPNPERPGQSIHYFNREQQARAVLRWHMNPRFRPCKDCPHEEV